MTFVYLLKTAHDAGYIGKLVLESLFRTCPTIKKVWNARQHVNTLFMLPRPLLPGQNHDFYSQHSVSPPMQAGLENVKMHM